MFTQNFRRQVCRRLRLLAVAYTINHRQQHAVIEWFDQLQITGDALTVDWPRCNAPIYRCLCF
ncbi:MAG TPA: hypothetical protein VGR14_06395 [Verrucomicrobiae bacterium]|nr:hypothetical protein [Verrucomicrobiae bacterium]